MSTPVPDISPLDTYHAAEDVLLLDVREDDEWAAGHAPGAAHMALSRLDPSTLNRATSIIAICLSGNRSGKAAARLAEAGFTIWNMTGGMNEWQKLGLPVQTDDASPGSIARAS